jgi:hypothetical protein
MSFKDVWNPTDEEIIAWAKSDEGMPEEDFDLALITEENDGLLISLAQDKNSHKRNFFIHVLYFMIGDAVYLENTDRMDYLKNFLTDLEFSDDAELEKWKNESIELLNNTDKFDYDYWCHHMPLE